MARDEPNGHDDQFAELLAEYHEGLLSRHGTVGDSDRAQRLDPAMRSRLIEAQQCLLVLEQVRRRGDPPPPPVRVAETIQGIDSTTSADQCDTPRTIGRFHVVRELGRGGYGVVFLARDPLLRREVALKVPRPDALLNVDLRRRFVREAQAAARLTHPNVVALHEVGEVGPVCFIASAYCSGPTLAEWLREQPQPPPPRLAADVVAALADAVHYAHTQGVLHRDLKPSNVLLEPKVAEVAGGPDDKFPFVPKVTDFGLAKLAENDTQDTHTRSGATIGTPNYMAPEQADGRLDDVGPRTDVYALGALLYEMLTGKQVFRGSTDLDTLHRVIVEEPLPPSRWLAGLPTDLEAICLKCLEKAPGRRYVSAAALGEDLRRFLAGEATEARPLSAAGRLSKWARRRPAIAALVAVSFVAATTIAAGSLWYSARLRSALVESDQQRTLAEAARYESEKSRLATLAQEEIANQYLYASRVRLAYQSLSQADVPQAASLLAEYDDGSRFTHLRGFEWHYARRALHEERFTLAGHTQAYAVAFSPDGRGLATGGKDGIVRLWDPITGRKRGKLVGHASCVNQVAFSPDGALLATASCDGTIKLWNAADRSELPLLVEPAGAVLCLTFSPDGKWLAAGGANRGTTIIHVPQRRAVASLEGEPIAANWLAFSPDGRLLAAADHGPDGRPNLSLWETGAWTRRASLGVSASSVAFSPDSKTLAVGDFDGLVRLFSVTHSKVATNARERFKLRGHAAAVHSIVFSPDGKSLASGSDDRTVRIWKSVDDRQPPASAGRPAGSGAHATAIEPRRIARVLVGHTDRVQGLAFAPDGRTLASASLDGTIKLWDVAHAGAGAPVWRVENDFSSSPWTVEVSPDMKQLALVDEKSRLRLSNVADGGLVDQTSALDGCSGFAFSPDGATLAAINESDQTITLYQYPALAPIRALPSRSALPGQVRLSSQARVIASAGKDGFIRVRALPDEREIYSQSVIKADDPTANSTMRNLCLALSGDGRTLAIGNFAHDQGLVDLGTGDRSALPIDSHRVGLMAFSPDDRLLAVSSSDRAVRLIDRDTRSLKHILWHSAPLRAMAFSPDSRTLATAIDDGPVVLWHVVTGQRIAMIEDLPRDALTLRFARDGLSLAALVELRDHTGGELYLLSAAGK